MTSSLLPAVTWAAASGRSPQAFLDAAWVRSLLDRLPAARRRRWALRLLSLSPHYFFRQDGGPGDLLSFDRSLENEFERNVSSRRKICEQLLGRHLTGDSVIVDYGCGPGFLAKAMAPRVGRVYACDISSGVLACARALNAHERVTYLEANPVGMNAIPDESVDVVASIAVVQHVTDEVLVGILELCLQKLKPGGRIVLHAQMRNAVWRSEAEWRADRTVRGRARFRYGLHCFGRDEESLRGIVSRCGFTDVKIAPIRDLVEDDFDDVCRQHLLTAEKS